jgi:fatty acid synthase subunit alpha, fungi type/fatty acid synthase subunit beta, fungi type
VSTTTNVWIAAEVLRDAFLHSVQGEDFPADDDAPALAYFAKFLGFLASNLNASAAHTTVLHSSLVQFTTAHLSNLDVHTLVASSDPDTRKEILGGYFAALAALESRVPAAEVPRSPPSALFAAAKSSQASIYGLFGGQGSNEVYFDELKALFDIYRPYVTDLITVVTKNILQPAAEKASLDGFTYYAHGLDVLGWLNGSVTLPPLEYLASVPISFPLIGLAQLVQYLVTARVSNLSPGELRSIIQGATGHSQGMVSAVAIAASTTSDSYTTNVSKAIKWLFYMGLRGQDAFPVLALEPKIVQDAVEGGEGTPTPMLAVSGLTLKALKVHIDSTNLHLPTNSKLFVSLNNGPKNFVVTGPSRALYGLVTALRKIRAPTGLDQSKVPFSQRKTVFSTRFLLVNVPYHSDYLIGATDKVLDIDLAGEELWSPSELQIPVYHTEDGAF